MLAMVNTHVYEYIMMIDLSNSFSYHFHFLFYFYYMYIHSWRLTVYNSSARRKDETDVCRSQA